MSRVRGLLLVLLFAAQLNAQNLSFVTCPIVRDTKTVPCWLAEYKGETYYLGNQGGVAQDFYPPQLNHEVLVEGVVAQGLRVCGGIPLRPVKTSVFLEINRASVNPLQRDRRAGRTNETRERGVFRDVSGVARLLTGDAT